MATVIDRYPTLKPQVGLEVGIEIEMEGDRLPMALNNWAVLGDGSLRGHSAEFVLSKPIKAGDVVPRLQELVKAFKECKSVLNPSDRCGVHVHINCQQMVTTHVFNLAVIYFILEDLLVRYCGDDREGNLFCLRARDAEGLIDTLTRCSKNNDFRALQSDTYRYASLNFSSLKKYGSLEFRALATPKNVLEIDKWVQMLLRARDYALKFKHPNEIIDKFSQVGALKFVTEVMGPFTNELVYRGYEDDLWNGLRLVQPVAYMHDPKKNEVVLPGLKQPLDDPDEGPDVDPDFDDEDHEDEQDDPDEFVKQNADVLNYEAVFQAGRVQGRRADAQFIGAAAAAGKVPPIQPAQWQQFPNNIAEFRAEVDRARKEELARIKERVRQWNVRANNDPRN